MQRAPKSLKIRLAHFIVSSDKAELVLARLVARLDKLRMKMPAQRRELSVRSGINRQFLERFEDSVDQMKSRWQATLRGLRIASFQVIDPTEFH